MSKPMKAVITLFIGILIGIIFMVFNAYMLDRQVSDQFEGVSDRINYNAGEIATEAPQTSPYDVDTDGDGIEDYKDLDPHNNLVFVEDEVKFTDEIIMEWFKQVYADEVGVQYSRLDVLDLSDSQLKKVAKNSANGMKDSLRSQAVINCFINSKVFKGDETKDVVDLCIETVKKAMNAGDISAEALYVMLKASEATETETITELSKLAKSDSLIAQLTMMSLNSEELPWIEMAIEQGYIGAILDLWSVSDDEEGADIRTVTLLEKAFEGLMARSPKSETLFELKLLEAAEVSCELESGRKSYLTHSEAWRRASNICEKIENYEFRIVLDGRFWTGR